MPRILLVALAALGFGCAGRDAPDSEPGTDSASGSTSGTGTGAVTGGVADVPPDQPPSAARLYARARCAAAERCACAVEDLGSVTQCEISVEDRFLAWQQRFTLGTFDVECFDQVIAFYEALECETRQEITLGGLAPTCDLYTGTQQVGEVCFAAGATAARGNECGDGLRCVATLEGRQCHPEGTVFVAALGETCAVGSNRIGCEAGSYCDSGSQVCRPVAADGAPCADPTACDVGLWCDPNASMCAPRDPPGSSCISTASCAPGDCVEGVCAAPICLAGVCDPDVPQVCLLSDL